MANDTLLELVQQAAGEMGLSVPTSVVGSQVEQTQQYLYLINGKGRQVAREYEWNATQKQYVFTTQFLETTGDLVTDAFVITGIPSTAGIVANKWQVLGSGIMQNTYVTSVDSATQVTINQALQQTGVGAALQFCQTAYDLPSGFDRLVDNTQWDRSKHWQILGPVTQQQTAWLNSGYIATGPRIQWYLQADRFQIWPPQTSNDVLGFNYISKNWVLAAGDTEATKQKFTADTDTCIFPNEMMVLALKLCMFEIKGFDTTAIYRDFMDQKGVAWAYDQAAPTLTMAPRGTSVLVTWLNTPDSGYGMPSGL